MQNERSISPYGSINCRCFSEQLHFSIFGNLHVGRFQHYCCSFRTVLRKTPISEDSSSLLVMLQRSLSSHALKAIKSNTTLLLCIHFSLDCTMRLICIVVVLASLDSVVESAVFPTREDCIRLRTDSFNRRRRAAPFTPRILPWPPKPPGPHDDCISKMEAYLKTSCVIKDLRSGRRYNFNPFREPCFNGSVYAGRGRDQGIF